MNIIIRNSSERPIYEQITEQIKKMIITGELKHGSPLPSIRALAKELRISVITTKQAYSELKNEGFIETVSGKGSFITEKSAELAKGQNVRTIRELLREAAALARQNGINISDLLKMMNELYDKGDIRDE